MCYGKAKTMSVLNRTLATSTKRPSLYPFDSGNPPPQPSHSLQRIFWTLRWRVFTTGKNKKTMMIAVQQDYDDFRLLNEIYLFYATLYCSHGSFGLRWKGNSFSLSKFDRHYIPALDWKTMFCTRFSFTRPTTAHAQISIYSKISSGGRLVHHSSSPRMPVLNLCSPQPDTMNRSLSEENSKPL